MFTVHFLGAFSASTREWIFEQWQETRGVWEREDMQEHHQLKLTSPCWILLNCKFAVLLVKQEKACHSGFTYSNTDGGSSHRTGLAIGRNNLVFSVLLKETLGLSDWHQLFHTCFTTTGSFSCVANDVQSYSCGRTVQTLNWHYSLLLC